MDEINSLIAALRESWRALIPGAPVRALAAAAIFFSFYYVLVLMIERRCGTRTQNYRSRGFAHDVAYLIYYRGGLHKYVFPAAVVAAAGDSVTFLQFKLLDGLPFWAKVAIWLPVADFIGYWVHRARHQYGFLWAFHTTHHSQEQVNFATYSRTHPVEDITGQFVGLFLLLLLGATPVHWFLLYIFLDMIGELQHTQIPWKFGPLRWIFVTPRFHIYHHSTDPAHHDRNYGILFSFWDRLFGTVVDESSPQPVKFGLDDVKPTSLWSTLVDPFALLYRMYGPATVRTREPFNGDRRPG